MAYQQVASQPETLDGPSTYLFTTTELLLTTYLRAPGIFWLVLRACVLRPYTLFLLFLWLLLAPKIGVN